MDIKPAITPRRSPRHLSAPKTPQTPVESSSKTPKRTLNIRSDNSPPPPITPSPSESRKRKTPRNPNPRPRKTLTTPSKPKRIYYKKAIYDGGEFEVGDDVYVKRREGEESESEPEVEECRICFKVGNMVMIECDECLGGFHLRCLDPPIKKVPEGDWVCGFCERRRRGETVEMPKPPEGKKARRTAKEKLLASDLWAARIER